MARISFLAAENATEPLGRISGVILYLSTKALLEVAISPRRKTERQTSRWEKGLV